MTECMSPERAAQLGVQDYKKAKAAAKALERAVKNVNDAGLILMCGSGSIQLRGHNAYPCVRSVVFTVRGHADGGDSGDEDREFDDLFKQLDLMEM